MPDFKLYHASKESLLLGRAKQSTDLSKGKQEEELAISLIPRQVTKPSSIPGKHFSQRCYLTDKKQGNPKTFPTNQKEIMRRFGDWITVLKKT